MSLSFEAGFFLFTAAYLSGAFGGLLATKFIVLKPLGPIDTWREYLPRPCQGRGARLLSFGLFILIQS